MISGVSSIIIILLRVPFNSLIQAFASVVLPVPTPPPISIFAPFCISSTRAFLYSSFNLPDSTYSVSGKIFIGLLRKENTGEPFTTFPRRHSILSPVGRLVEIIGFSFDILSLL